MEIKKIIIWEIGNDGPLYYDDLGKKEWIRELDKKVCQYGEQIYGMSQNPYTNHYILVTMICKSCLINNLKINFTKWTSENEQIDVFIKKKRQLQIKNYDNIVFEWIPYNGFW
ncbi:hypothetical protein RhiirA5_439096 [Rhizophagus irregularis]|uniref:Uncharacterized protein n=1 Tax=Rhizophagus irregularis TaxID=588596 RepID=A0A2N0NIA1_9GLOM|nr:hypothetical protein RhiirA5_439096 [Rhizophagus irregularis]